MRDDAAVRRQRRADGRRIRLVRGLVSRRARRREAQILAPYRALAREQHGALDRVAQLAHVAGPRVRDEGEPRVLGEQVLGAEEVLGERQDVVGSRRERRHGEL